MVSVSTQMQPFSKNIQGHNYRIKLASSEERVQEAQALRYQVFSLELGHAKANSLKLDQDRYDEDCDQLIVIDVPSDKVVGTYRLLPTIRAQRHHGYYSETEFSLNNLTSMSANFLEVGRACVHPEFRDGSALNALWYGLARYMAHGGFDYMFGCASLSHEDDVAFASQVYAYARLNDKLVPSSHLVTPLWTHRLSNFDLKCERYPDNIKRQLPPLLRGYFSLGCKIGGEPAYDGIWEVIDFFVLLDFNHLPKSARRFLK